MGEKLSERFALLAAETAAKLAVTSQVSYDEALDALMRAGGFVPATEAEVKLTGRRRSFWTGLRCRAGRHQWKRYVGSRVRAEDGADIYVCARCPGPVFTVRSRA